MASAPHTTRCAACKYMSRRCGQDCVLAPFFPPSDSERYARVHKIFGASNVTRMLLAVPVEERMEAANSIALEAYWRVCEPVHGSAGVVYMYQQEIERAKLEIARTRAQFAMHSSQQQFPRFQQPPNYP